MLAWKGWKFAGLSTFDPFPDGNASQVDTKTRLEASFCPQIPTPSRQVSLAANAMILQTAQHRSQHTVAGIGSL